MTYIQPLTPLFLFMIVIGLYKLRHRYRTNGWRIMALGVVGLVCLTWPLVDWLFSRPLEMWYPKRAFPPGEPEAIVVLASTVEPPEIQRPFPLPDRPTYERCRYAAWLFKNWRAKPILTCGGGNLGKPYSATMRLLLQSEGVPASMIWTEERSSSTYQNALYGAEILRKNSIHTVALVVEAIDMLRAEKCFRRQGLVVLPAPCSFRTFKFGLDEFLPGWHAILHNERVLHEIVGLLWYRIRGWI